MMESGEELLIALCHGKESNEFICLEELEGSGVYSHSVRVGYRWAIMHVGITKYSVTLFGDLVGSWSVVMAISDPVVDGFIFLGGVKAVENATDMCSVWFRFFTYLG